MFVSFEGPEGSGKSTALAGVAERLSAAGYNVVKTREPGAGELGVQIRRILLDGGDLPSEAELFLFLADRANHVRTLIGPALATGAVVLCDRYADSTLVYQGWARRLSQSFLREANKFATGGLTPDLTLLFDLPPAAGLARIANKDRLDSQPIEFHERVRAGFLELAAEEPQRWAVIDALQPADTVIYEAVSQVLERLKSRAS